MVAMLGASLVGLGTAPIGSRAEGPLWWGPQDDDESVATVVAAIDAGIDWIDTAPFYGWGHAEEMVGRALTIRPGQARVLTKCGTRRGSDGRAYEDASADSLRAGAIESLRRLGVERIDVLQVHDPDPDTPIEATWTAMMALISKGLVGAGGLSNHSVELMDRALAVGPVAVVQHQYSLLWREPEHDGVIAWCTDHGVPFLAWSPLASGFLVDSFDLERLHPDDLRRRLRWTSGDGAALTLRTRRTLGDIAAAHGATIQAAALAWITQRGHRAIVGARTPAEAVALARLPTLTADDMAKLSS